MGRLLLMRHGKSDWNADFQADHDRPINERGVLAARTIGSLLRGQSDYIPGLILCSTATRTRETLNHVRLASGWEQCEIDYLEELYLAAPSRALHVISERAPSTVVVMVVGHQPTLSGLLSLLTGGNQADYPTAALAVVDIDQSDWKNSRLRGQGVLHALIPPRIL